MKSMLIFYLVYEFLELICVTQSCHFSFYLYGLLVCLPACLSLSLSLSFCLFFLPALPLCSRIFRNLAGPVLCKMTPDQMLASPDPRHVYACGFPCITGGQSNLPVPQLLQGLVAASAPPCTGGPPAWGSKLITPSHLLGCLSYHLKPKPQDHRHWPGCPNMP